MSPSSEPWWGAFVSRLRVRPLAAVAEELGRGAEALLEALREADPGGPAEEAPWWPEVLRLRDTMPIRALARMFGTEPRRIRRALARAGLRVGGEELSGKGVPALAPFLDRLGKMPDADLAREASVAVEAVQGERRRLGVAPYRPPVVEARPARPPAPELTREEEAWIRGPEPVRRKWEKPDADALEVVRRPLRAADRRAGGPDVRGEAAPERRFGPPDRRAPTTVAPERPRLSEAPAPGDGARRVSRDFFRGGREEPELNRLLEGTPRPRDGRQRIVRADAPRGAALPTTLPAFGARPAAPRGEARAADASLAGARPADASPPTPIRVPAVVAAPKVAGPLASGASSIPAPKLAATPVSGAPNGATAEAAPTPEPAPARTAAATKPAATKPAAPIPAATKPAPARIPVATKVVPGVAARPPVAAASDAPARASAAPTPIRAPVVAAPAPALAPTPILAPRTWLVRYPGAEVPFVVDAPDVLSAARAAASRLPPDLWAAVAIELAGAQAPAGRRDNGAPREGGSALRLA